MVVHQVSTEQEFKERISKGTTLVTFTAQWCGPCKRIFPLVLELSEQHPFTFLKVDINELDDLASYENVQAVPSFVLYRDKERLGKVVGSDQEGLRDLCRRASW